MDTGLAALQRETLPDYVMPSGRRMTVEQWANLPEEDEGELVNGLLVEEEMADPQHEIATISLATALRLWVRPLGGHVLGSEVKLALGDHHGRKPDVAVFMPGRTGLARRGPVRVPPDICVEVVSSAPRDHRRDRVAKLDEYAAFGVRYYWLVDPEARTLEIFERGSKGLYTRVLGASGGALASIPGCAGMKLDLDDLWAEIDQLPPDDTTPSEPARRPRTAARRVKRPTSSKKAPAKR